MSPYTSLRNTQRICKKITGSIQSHWGVDAIYLYGSRSRGSAGPESDWDVAVLFSDYETNPLQRQLRPQDVEAQLQRELNLYGTLSIVDLAISPAPLQYNIIHGTKLYDGGVPHVRRMEGAIISKIEKDYMSCQETHYSKQT